MKVEMNRIWRAVNVKDPLYCILLYDFQQLYEITKCFKKLYNRKNILNDLKTTEWDTW